VLCQQPALLAPEQSIFPHSILFTMKAVVLASLLGSVAAFAPAQQRAATSSLAASAELEGMVGVDLETGKKIVSKSA